MTQASLADITEGDPRITRRDILWCLRHGSIIRGYIDFHVLHRQFMSHNIDSEAFYRLPPRINCDDFMTLELFEELCNIPNGSQIFYRCLRETQDIPWHRILADDIEEKVRKSKCNM